MSKPNPVVHFEMGYFDKTRAKKFYESTFGWKGVEFGADANYVVMETTETKEMRPTTPGAINGGLYAKTDSPDSHPPSFVIAVDDIKQAMKDVVANGGKIKGGMTPDGKHTMEPTMIPSVGLWISCEDTEKNRFSLLQPSRG